MTIWFFSFFLESAFVELFQAERANKMLRVELPEHGSYTPTWNYNHFNWSSIDLNNSKCQFAKYVNKNILPYLLKVILSNFKKKPFFISYVSISFIILATLPEMGFEHPAHSDPLRAWKCVSQYGAPSCSKKFPSTKGWLQVAQTKHPIHHCASKDEI